MYPFHDALQRLNRRLREHAVAEVEDVTGATRSALEHVAHPRLELRGRRQESHGVEVALNRLPGAHTLPGDVQGHTPVHPDHVAARTGEVRQKRRRAGAEMDHRDAGRSRELQRPLAVREHIVVVVRRRETAYPTVEQLQRPGAAAGSSGTRFASRIGRVIRGPPPSPATKLSPSPSGSNGSRMSANRMAASTPSRSTGCSVTRAASSGW